MPPSYPEGMYFKEPLSWDDEEDRKLLDAVESMLKSRNWSLVASFLNNDAHVRGRLRTAQQCSDRYRFLKLKQKPQHQLTTEDLAALRKEQTRGETLERQRQAHAARQREQTQMAQFKNGMANLCASFSRMQVHTHFKRAMSAVEAQRQACKNALRASLSELNDTSAKAIMQIVHASHQNSLAEGRHQLGVPASVPVTKTLTPRQIIELRQRRNRHLIRHRQMLAQGGQTGQYGRTGVPRGNGRGTPQAGQPQQQPRQGLPQQQQGPGGVPQNPQANGPRGGPPLPGQPGGSAPHQSPRYPGGGAAGGAPGPQPGGQPNNGQQPHVSAERLKEAAMRVIKNFPDSRARVTQIYQTPGMSNNEKFAKLSLFFRQMKMNSEQQQRLAAYQREKQHREQQQQQQQQHAAGMPGSGGGMGPGGPGAMNAMGGRAGLPPGPGGPGVGGVGVNGPMGGRGGGLPPGAGQFGAGPGGQLPLGGGGLAGGNPGGNRGALPPGAGPTGSYNPQQLQQLQQQQRQRQLQQQQAAAAGQAPLPLGGGPSGAGGPPLTQDQRFQMMQMQQRQQQGMRR